MLVGTLVLMDISDMSQHAAGLDSGVLSFEVSLHGETPLVFHFGLFPPVQSGLSEER